MLENNPFRKVTSQKDVTKIEVEDTKVEVKEPEIKMVKVITTLNGWYNNRRIEIGEELTVPENLVSKVWMKKL